MSVLRRIAESRAARAAIFFALSLTYLAHIFHIDDGRFRTHGLGDWLDPHFINFLLEHWTYSFVHLHDPSSPLIYFPARHTLGYSHGLVLFAPFYMLVRPFTHPIIANNIAIFLVMELGIACLYVVLRKFALLSVVESLVLIAFFTTSPNIVNGELSQWAQRASVFLIPPIALIGFVAHRRQSRTLAFVAGLLAALLLTQDFPTSALAAMIAALLVIPLGARLPAWYTRVCAYGASIGVAIFLAIYLPAYREHPAFPLDQIIERLRAADLRHLNTYWTSRPFLFAFALAVVAFVPFFKISRKWRAYLAWLLVVTLFVIVAPLRFGKFAIWLTLTEHVPGFSALRDPSRLIYIYELAVVCVAALMIWRHASSVAFRRTIVAIALVLMATQWSGNRLELNRPITVFDQWVAPPIDVDPRCRSFFIKGASDAFMVSSDHMWSLYGVDASFIALKYRLPTLNGYSAWSPAHWDLANPQEQPYMGHVDDWIRRNSLHDVCALDIDARTMRLYMR